MKNILARANREILEQFAGSDLLVALDYDGTLAPIVADPTRAEMRPSTRELLRAVSRLYPCVVISGRAHADVVRRLDGAGPVSVVGNHGAEPIEGSAAMSGFKREVERWTPLLKEHLAPYPGVTIEDKAFSVSVHYRRSREKKRARAAILQAARSLGDIRVVGGKLVVNLLPHGAPHKGMALESERARRGCATAIYVGDDETDEDVFTLDQPGRLLTIRVGAKRGSRASYYVKGQAEVDDLLRELVDLGQASPPRRGGRSVSEPISPAIEPPPAFALGEVLDFLRLLWAVDHALQRASKRMEVTLGMTGPQRLVIRILGRFPGSAAGDLARVLHVHPSTLTGVLQRLERRGLIRRRSDPRDARRSLLWLTSKGRRFDVEREGTVEAATRDALATFSPETLRATRDVLQSIAHALERSAPA